MTDEINETEIIEIKEPSNYLKRKYGDEDTPITPEHSWCWH